MNIIQVLLYIMEENRSNNQQNITFIQASKKFNDIFYQWSSITSSFLGIFGCLLLIIFILKISKKFSDSFTKWIIIFYLTVNCIFSLTILAQLILFYTITIKIYTFNKDNYDFNPSINVSNIHYLHKNVFFSSSFSK